MTAANDPTAQNDRFMGAPTQAIAAHDGAPLATQVGDTLRLQLNRPAQHNRLDPADIDALQRVLDRVGSENTLRAILITGAGERSFSSGYTLEAITSQLDQRFERMLDTLESLPQVTIAALNGSVYGGATDLALCCDLRLGTAGMRMFMPAARFGLHYYPGGLRRYVNRIGLSAASKLFLTGMTIESEEMLRIGFLTEVVAREELAARVQAYLSAIELTDPNVVGQMKRHLRAVAERTADFAELDRAYQQSLNSAELKRRVKTLLKQS